MAPGGLESPRRALMPTPTRCLGGLGESNLRIQDIPEA